MRPLRRFYFDKFKFDFNTYRATFFYNFDEKEFFEEVIDFKSKGFRIRKDVNKKVINNILFHIHIALGISYYKIYPTKELVVRSGYLDEQAMNFWIKFYKNGLGEFLYKNEISPKKLFNFMNMSSDVYEKIDFNLKDRSLIALGGGKDSIVSVELFNQTDFKFNTVVFGKLDEIKKSVSKKIGKRNLLIERKMSDNLFKLNKQGYYNGHIPITGITSFVLILSSYLYNYKYIVLSNEKSADFPNTIWKNLDINHQYSKSLEFEIDLDNYIKRYIGTKTRYFSLLRGMYEYKIAKLFSKLGKEYMGIFSSCNNNFKIKKDEIKDEIKDEEESLEIIKKEEEKQKLKTSLWCNSCPKCIFVYILLSAFLSKKKLMEIFGRDLYEYESLWPTFEELFGISGIKPFECVGDKQEVILAAYKAIKNYKGKLPYNLKLLKEKVLDKITPDEYKKLKKEINYIYKEDLIPEKLREKIKILNKK